MSPPAHCSQDAILDHNQDLRKNYIEPEAGGLTSTPINAMEVAVLVKAVSITVGAELIEQYARTVAAEARLDQTQITANRILAGIEAPLSRKDAPYGEWCRKPDACAGKGYCPLDPTCGD